MYKFNKTAFETFILLALRDYLTNVLCISVKENLKTLGVASDANEVVTKIKSVKNQFIETRLGPDENIDSNPKPKSKPQDDSTEVVQKLEKQAKDSKKHSTFRFSNEQVMWLSYMMDTHKDNYKAMARDPKNHYQETPAAIRQKIKRFISIPDHWVVYCRERGMLDKVAVDS